MIRFKDRIDASDTLLPELKKFADGESTIIVGLPRGGMITAAHLAKMLNLPLDFIIVKKVGAPGNSELALGAVTEDGIYCLDEELIELTKASPGYVSQKLHEKQLEAAERYKLYRGDNKPPSFKDKQIILVDDGMATGSTMLAALKAVRARRARSVIVAVPVASLEAVTEVKKAADGFVCPMVEPNLESVGEYYENFPQVEDAVILALL